MKNIWIWNHYATNMFFDRGGRHYSFAKYLIKMQYSPTIFCANTYHNRAGYIETGNGRYATNTVSGIPFVFVKTSQYKGNGLSRIKNMLQFTRNIVHAGKICARVSRPDVIIASSVHPLTCVAGIRVAKKLKIPCIVEIRDLWPEAVFSYGSVREQSIIGKLLLFGEHWIYSKANAIIFTKEGDIDYLREREWLGTDDVDPRKCFYINNGVDLEEFFHNISIHSVVDADLDSGKYSITYCGAIRPVNSVETILDAAKILSNNNDIQFLIYGEGTQLEHLRHRIDAEHITNVKLKGQISKQCIPYVLSKSSLNLLNYSDKLFNWKRGNSSNKLFEYMASGKPILSTVRMGYDIIERYNCGFSLEEVTPESMVEAIYKISHMSEAEQEELGRNAFKGAKDFDYSVLIDKLILVIESVITQ